MASIWDKLKKSLGGTYDNLNIFDNGKTASKPASPVQMNPIAQLRDMIDANSPRDVYNRQQSGQPAIYRDQQIQMGNTRPHVNLGGQIFGSTARFINSGKAAGEMSLRELIEQPRFQIAKFTGNQGAQQAYFDRQRQFNETTFDPNAGLFGEGTIFKNSSEVGNLSVAELTKRVGLNTAGTALEVIPMAKGASIAPKSGAAKVATRIAGNAGASAGQDIIDQTQNRDNFSKEQLALSTLLGTVLPEGLGAVSRRLPKDIPSIKGDQRGALGFGDDGNQDKLGDILGSIEIKKQNLADIIAAEFGGKTADIQRNIDRYGLQPTNEMYQRVGKAGTANNVDAVVTSELKKLYPKKLFNDDGVWKAYEQNPEAYAPQARELPPEADTFVDVPQVGKTPKFERDLNTGKMKMVSEPKTPVKTEKYSIVNSDISRTRSPGMNEDGFTVEDWGGKKRYVSLEDASVETRTKVRKAEAEYEAAKKANNGTALSAKQKVNDAYSDAIDDLKLQDYATTENGGRTFNSKYNDWLETKYKDRNIDSATIKDMAANPQKYRSQFEAETTPVAQVDKTGYRGAHQIESNTSRNIGEINSIEDIAAQVKSKYGLTNNDHKNIGKLNKIIGNPDADVKVYRASPVGELNSGDWVTNDKIYANDIKRQNGGKVYEYTVKAKELNLPANIEDNPSLARFSAFQYSKSDIAPQARGLPPEANTFIDAQDTQPTVKADKPVTEAIPVTPKLREVGYDYIEQNYDPYDPYIMDNRLSNGRWAVNDNGEVMSLDEVISSRQNMATSEPTIKANEPSVDTPILDEPVKDAVEPTNAVNTQAEAPKATELIHIQSLDKNVSVADATDNVAKTLDAVSNEMDVLDSELKANGSSLESVLREVQLANRENIELSPQAADILANRIKPILDSARQLSIDAGVKIGDIPNAYAPQMKAGRTRTVRVGGNLIDELSFTGVGSAERRLNQITLDELDYSKDSILDYVAQHLNQHYKEHNILKDIIFVEAEKGREVTEDAAKNILNVTKEVANKIQKTMDTAISIDDKAANAVGIADTDKFVKNIQKLDVLGELNKIGDAKLIPRKTIDNKLSLAESTVRSQFQIFNGIKVGDLTLSQALGQELYMNADAYANRALREHIETGFPAGDIIAGAFDMTTLSESTKKSLIENINRISSDDVTDVEALYKIASNIKGAAAIQAIDFGENYNVTDPTLRKLINMQISRNITKDGYNRTLGSKLASAFTSAVHRGALYFNVKSSVANITELPRVAALLGSDFPDSLRKAFQDVAQSKIPGREFDSITAKYGINERSAGDLLARERNKYRQTMRKRFVEQADRVGLQMFNTTEAVKDATVLYGLEAKYAREGYVGVDLTRKVMKEFNTYSIKGGFDNAIGLQRSSAGRALFQFVTYPIRNTDIMLTQTKKALLEKDRKALGFLAIYTGGVAATYATIGAVLGMPIEYILGVFNPAEDNMNRDSGATDEVISRLPGGPLVDAMKDIYFGAKDEMAIAKEDGREFDVSNLWNSATKKDASLLIPGSVQFNKVMGGKKLLETGYDASAKGLARYAAPTDNYNKAMALIFGKSSTSNAREYFGTQGIGGDLPNMGGEKQLPVSKQWQELIDRAGNNPAVIEDIINRARTARKDQTDFFKENPTLKAVYEQATFIKYDPKTGKGVSDVITPDKWKSIQSDTTLSLYEFMREKAMLNNREFGVPVDPIYKLQDDNKIREVMQLRALPTGDDTEIKDILQGKDWYKQFEKDYAEYIKTQLASGTTDIENSPRKAEYLKIQSENPAQAPKSDVMQQYEFYRNAGDEDSRKAFYADNAEKLSAEYSKRSEDYRVWTNKMRAIEGVDPISKEVWDNSTRGFNYDELKTAKSIAAKNNAYLKEFTPYSSGGSSRSTGRSSGAGSNRVARVDYGNVKSLQTAKLVKPKKVKIVNKKAKNGTIKVSKGKIKI